MTKACVVSFLMTGLIAAGAAAAATEQPLAPLMKRDGNTLVALHSLPFVLSGPAGFRAVEPVTHDPEFHGHPFHATIGALVASDGSRFVMAHAERVMDGAPALVYSGLAPASLGGVSFGKKQQCAPLDAETVKEEFDLSFLTSGGAQLMPAVLIEQYFTQNATHTEEFIVTLGVRLPDCDARTVSGEGEEALQELWSGVKLRRAR